MPCRFTWSMIAKCGTGRCFSRFARCFLLALGRSPGKRCAAFGHLFWFRRTSWLQRSSTQRDVSRAAWPRCSASGASTSESTASQRTARPPPHSRRKQRPSVTSGNNGSVYYVPYYVPYYPETDYDGQLTDEAPPQDDPDAYQGGPTIFDRRGPGERAANDYLPTGRERPSRPPPRTAAPEDAPPPAQLAPPEPPAAVRERNRAATRRS